MIRGRPRTVIAHNQGPRGTIHGQALRAATCRRSETAAKADDTGLGTRSRVQPGRDFAPTCPLPSTSSPVERQPWDTTAWRPPRLRREVIAEQSGRSAQVRSDAAVTPALEDRPRKNCQGHSGVPATIHLGASPPSFLLIQTQIHCQRGQGPHTVASLVTRLTCHDPLTDGRWYFQNQTTGSRQTRRLRFWAPTR